MLAIVFPNTYAKHLRDKAEGETYDGKEGMATKKSPRVPALVPGEGFVKGIMLQMDAPALEITDRIEGYSPDRDSCLYLREEVVVQFEDGQEAVAWTYLFANSASVTECPRLVVGKLNGVPLHAWPYVETLAERKRGRS